MKTQMIHTRIDENLKREAELVFSALGINTADAIRMFLTQVTLKRGIPFDVKYFLTLTISLEISVFFFFGK